MEESVAITLASGISSLFMLFLVSMLNNEFLKFLGILSSFGFIVGMNAIQIELAEGAALDTSVVGMTVSIYEYTIFTMLGVIVLMLVFGIWEMLARMGKVKIPQMFK